MEKGKSGSSFVNGLFMGTLVGIGLSIGITVFMTNGKSPFIAKDTNGSCIEIQGAAKPDMEAENAVQDQPTKFDFYNLLPNGDKDVSDKDATQALKNPAAIPAKEIYFFQIGAFSSEKDADNMKAKLALLGFEAVILTTPLPNNEISHKVRVGPMMDDAQIMQIKNDLIKNNFKPILVKAAPTNNNANH